MVHRRDAECTFAEEQEAETKKTNAHEAKRTTGPKDIRKSKIYDNHFIPKI